MTNDSLGPDYGAIIDQAKAEVTDKARVVAAYYLKIRAEGVEPYDALQLTLAMQERFLFDGGPDAQSEED